MAVFDFLSNFLKRKVKLPKIIDCVVINVNLVQNRYSNAKIYHYIQILYNNIYNPIL